MARYYKKTLSNGLRVVCIPQAHLHACEISCYVGVGSRFESTDQSGISHFLEHMLFRGTVDFPSSLELEQAFEALGGGANAATDSETTCYFSRFHPEQMSAGMALFASMLQRPLLDDIEIERRIILEEAQEDFNEQGIEINPDSQMARLLWPGTSLAQPTIGNLEVLASMDAQSLRDYHKRFYTPHNCVVAVAGKAEPEAVFAAAEDHFCNWQGPVSRNVAKLGDVTAGEKSIWVKDSASQLTVQLAFPLPGRGSDHDLNLRILRRLLSGGVTSRLMLRLRETLGLTYNIEANLTMLDETGALVVDFMVSPENLTEAMQEVFKIFVDLRNDTILPDEFNRVIRNYLYDLDFSQDHPDEMVTRYGWGEIVNFVRDMEVDRQAIMAVTASELTASARECLDPEECRLVVVGPYRRADQKKTELLLQDFAQSVR